MQSKKWSKNNLIALLVAIGLHLLLVLVVLLVVLPTHLHDKGGILVNIGGDVAFAQGDACNSNPSAHNPMRLAPRLPKSHTEEPLLTQDNPGSPWVVKAPEKKQPTAEELEHQRRLKAEEEARRKREDINSTSGRRFATRSGRATAAAVAPRATAKARQGSPDGNVPHGRSR